MERQGHGFSFEQKVEELFGVDRTNREYTDKWDGMLRGFPVSIKVAKLGTDIEMADIRRNAYNTEDFYLIVGFWEGEKTNIVKIETLFISGNEWHSLFNASLVEECLAFLKTVTNDKSDDEKWKEGRLSLSKRWKETTPNLIRPRFKRDHKTQKRIQCAINYKDFYNYFVAKYGVNI